LFLIGGDDCGLNEWKRKLRQRIGGGKCRYFTHASGSFLFSDLSALLSASFAKFLMGDIRLSLSSQKDNGQLFVCSD
jgi:hypothetical protein